MARWYPPLMVRFIAAAVSLASVGAFVACSATQDGGSFGDGGSGGSGAGSGAGTNQGAGPSFDGGLGGGGAAGPGCSEEAKLVYVVGQANELYSFYPPDLAFKQVGVINCPTGGFSQPFSMAVARNGTAYVLFTDGNIFAVDTKTAACQATGFVPNQAGLSTYGKAFVSNTSGSEDETLYVADYAGTGIAKIDTATMTLSFVGAYDTLTGSAELTGTGDARLFGFFLSTPVKVAEIDKTNGHILSQAPQPTVNIGSAWAFAFWGGDFYLFTNPTSTTSQVDRYRPSDGTTVTLQQNVGLSIVGAGVSTCAPITPPN